MGAQKSRLIETVLLSTHNICFGLDTCIRKIAFLSGGLVCGYCYGSMYALYVEYDKS